MKPSLEQLVRVPHVDSGYPFDVAPDGRHLAFSWNRSGAWELYELGLSAAYEPRALTHPPGGKFHPRYSPDGTKIAYALDLDGSESYHVAVLQRATGRSTDLTPDIAYSHQPNISWSPDGKALAVLSDAAGHFTCRILPVSGGLARLMLDVDHPCWDVHWSPNGDWIAVEVEWHRQDRSLFLVNVNDGAIRQLQQDGEPVNAMHPVWSPDARTLAMCADPSGSYKIGMYDLASESIRWLEAGEGEHTNPAWSADGQRVVCVYTRGADTALRIFHLSNGTAATHRLGPGIHSFPRFTPDGSALLFGFESPHAPNDMWLLHGKNGTCSQLTRSLPKGIDTSDFIIPVEVWYPSMDDVLVPAMLYRPRRPNSAALVNIHGGPNWLYQCNWHPLMSYLSARGWAVLAPNYRGSTGYGRKWAQANYKRLGEVDTLDCAAGAHYLVGEGLAEPGRIMITGRSHGGYLTMTCLTENPELWAAGSAVVPFLNWFTGHESSRHDLQHWDFENFGDPVTNAELWQRRSPFFYLDRIQAAVQFISGGHDPRCPVSETTAARDRLVELGKQVELIVYPDEGHVFLKLENVVDHELRRLAFLEHRARLTRSTER
jgi:dipeptidyl aminopeptidase/acylaminoacyl peptidase